MAALEESGAYDDTIVILTSDHGDMCGSHGLRSKGPFVYEEIMHVPCVVKVPGVTQPGSQTAALGTHVDLASTIVSLGGVDPTTQPSLRGVDLSPVLADPAASVRDHVLFAHDTAHTNRINNTRYAIRGFFDGRTKYARYYGVGGGKPGTGLWGKDPGRKLYDVDAEFSDQEHEWYDLSRGSARDGEPRPRPRPPLRATRRTTNASSPTKPPSCSPTQSEPAWLDPLYGGLLTPVRGSFEVVRASDRLEDVLAQGVVAHRRGVEEQLGAVEHDADAFAEIFGVGRAEELSGGR